jgi:hypothetical protein
LALFGPGSRTGAVDGDDSSFADGDDVGVLHEVGVLALLEPETGCGADEVAEFFCGGGGCLPALEVVEELFGGVDVVLAIVEVQVTPGVDLAELNVGGEDGEELVGVERRVGLRVSAGDGATGSEGSSMLGTPWWLSGQTGGHGHDDGPIGLNGWADGLDGGQIAHRLDAFKAVGGDWA